MPPILAPLALFPGTSLLSLLVFWKALWGQGSWSLLVA